MKRVVVIEANEVPLRILEWYADLKPRSTIARLLQEQTVTETVVGDEPMRGLYPSQTWATLGTGVPYEKHGIYWYGDPKPVDLPFYWQAAAEHRRVGVFGALHSSPVAEQATQPGFVFYVPDVFGNDDEVLPHHLDRLHRFNIRMTKENGRAVSSSRPLLDYLDGLRAIPRSGVRPRTLLRLGRTAARIAARRASRERLRTAQFVLLADVFLDQLDDHRPDLAVFFTNHVAAAMHRYWPAVFPDDWPEPPYGKDWVSRFSGEIPFAMTALDNFLQEVWAWCEAHDRVLVVASSMGQVGGGEVDRGGDRALVVSNARAFLKALRVPTDVEIRSAMVPHLTVVYPDELTAAREASRLQAMSIGGGSLDVDRASRAVTLTYHLEPIPGDDDLLSVDASLLHIDSVGLKWVEVNEHKSGVHDPRGVLMVANSPHAALSADPVDSIEVAPAVLELLGVPPVSHHVEPTISLG